VEKKIILGVIVSCECTPRRSKKSKSQICEETFPGRGRLGGWEWWVVNFVVSAYVLRTTTKKVVNFFITKRENSGYAYAW